MTFQIRLSAGAIASAMLTLAILISPAASQTLHDYVEAAASRNPELLGLSGRRDAITARQYAADRLTPGAPTVTGSYLTDQVLRDRRQREAQIGISTPIWLYGEGTASRRVADAELVRSGAQAATAKLKIAGMVRDSLAEFALAQAELGLAERRLRDARGLEADVGRRAGARDASEADLLLARAERLASDGELRERTLAVKQSKLDFETLTGMTPVLAALKETVPTETATAHPKLDDAKGAVDVARANTSLADIQTRDSPEIGLIARNSRDTFGTVYNNSIGVELRIPLSTEGRNRPRQAAAQAELTEAMVGLTAAERDIVLEQKKARLAYDNALVQRDLAVERSKALTRQSGLVARSFQGGQTALFDSIRARTVAYEAETASARAEIGVTKARSRLNQAFGVVP
jgi:cobalt-zinc-cadmium efflux system outer membrane protein